MRKICGTAAILVGCGVVPSWAQRPSTNYASDASGNIGEGVEALTSIVTGVANTPTPMQRCAPILGGNKALETRRLVSAMGNTKTTARELAFHSVTGTDNNTAFAGCRAGKRHRRRQFHQWSLRAREKRDKQCNNAIGEYARAENTTGDNNIAIGLDGLRADQRKQQPLPGR